MHGCSKCKSSCGWCLLVAGILFLLRDLGIWDFWGIQWWTVLFLLVGFGHVASTKCPDCKAEGKKK